MGLAPSQFPYPRQTGPAGTQAAKGNHGHTPAEVGAASSTHTHTESQVTNLVADLAGKANAVHTHAESDVTNLVSDLAGKAAATHSHAESDVTNLTTDLSNRLIKTNNLSDVSNATTARTNLGAAAATHTHAESDVTNLTTDLAAKPIGYVTESNQITSAASITATAAPGTTIVSKTFTVTNGRRYKVTAVAYGTNFGTAAENLQFNFNITAGTGSAAFVGSSARYVWSSKTGNNNGLEHTAVFTASATGTITLDWAGFKQTGTGTMQVNASAGNPAMFFVEDIGT